MAKFSSVNQFAASAGLGVLFAMKTVLKLAGWTVPRSSDGTTYNASGDQITIAGSGAGGMGNTNAWYVIREPGGRREWCFQRGTTDANWRIKYSALAKFTGGSPAAGQTPAATDEQVMIGGGSNASPTYTQTFFSGQHRYHIIAQTIPISGCYPFMMFCIASPGSTYVLGNIFQEPMAPGSFSSADDDPCVVGVDTGGSFPPTNTKGWFAYGTGAQAFQTVSYDTIITAGGIGADLETSEDPNVRPRYFATVTGAERQKGFGALMAVKGLARVYPATMNTATDAYVFLSNYLVPYADNTVPSVA